MAPTPSLRLTPVQYTTVWTAEHGAGRVGLNPPPYPSPPLWGGDHFSTPLQQGSPFTLAFHRPAVPAPCKHLA